MQARKKRKIAGEKNIPKSFNSIFNKRKKYTKRIIHIYYNCLYRFVSRYENLWGVNVHVSKGELASSAYKTDDQFKHVPFSHAECDVGALFEMEESEMDILEIQPKMHAPGTGVVSFLFEEFVRVKRIFYSKNIDKDFLKKIKEYEANGVEIISFDFDNISKHHFKLIRRIEDDCLKKNFL